MKNKQNPLKHITLALSLVIFSAFTSKVNASITIVYELAYITSGSSNIGAGTVLIISSGGDGVFDSGSGWATGSTNFLRNDDKFISAFSILNGVASATRTFEVGTLASGLPVVGHKLTALFISGLTSAQLNYSTGSLLTDYYIGSGQGGAATSYQYGSYRNDIAETFDTNDTDANIAFIIPSNSAVVNLSAYTDNYATFVQATNDVNASLSTINSLQISQIPEPSTGALIMIGAVGLVALRRLRKV